MLLADKSIHPPENSLAAEIKQELEAGKFVEATDTWGELEDVISASSNSVVIKFSPHPTFSFVFLFP